jgi:hypothetical protein
MSLSYYIQHPSSLYDELLNQLGTFIKNNETFIKLKWKMRMDYPLNLDEPKSFSEKIQWLKLNYREPSLSMMVDKIEAKKYVSSIVGEEYIIPTIGVWDTPDEIDFDKLPDKFVLKCNHNSGLGMFICKDRKKVDKDLVRKGLAKGLRQNYYIESREWPYKNVKPRILAEEFIGHSGENLRDYKFFCFGGEPLYCQVISGRGESKTTIDFYDMNWKHQPFHEPQKYPFSEKEVACPGQFLIMQNIAKKLSSGHPFMRVDLYEVDGKVFFGEMTFSPTSGMGGFKPQEWDYKMGELIHLPI